MIGEMLKKLRTIYEYKAKDVCEKLEISPSYLSEIENGKKEPSLELLKKYSKLFDIKLSSIIVLSENMELAKKRKRSEIFKRKMMISLINKFYEAKGEEFEEI